MTSGARSRLAFSPFAAVAAAIAGCAAEAPIDEAPPPPSGRDGGADAAVDPEPECVVPEFPDQTEPIPFERLEARVVDTDGRFVAGTMAQACGVDLCLFGDTDAEGRVVHRGEYELRKAAFKYGDGVRHAQLALLLGEGPEHDLGDQVTVAFPDLSTGSRFEPGQTLRSNAVELVLDGGTKVELDELTFDIEERVFVAAEFPEGAFPEAALGEEFLALFALGPVKTKLCPPARLVLPNSRDLEPGTELAVHLHSTDVRAEFAPYGEWEAVGTATVAADGETIATDPGQGLPMLGVIGIR